MFSNYQMVHRVLRMVNKAVDREASRDFVALFIVDPLHPLIPARYTTPLSLQLSAGELHHLSHTQVPPEL